MSRVSQSQAFQGVLQRQAVEDGGQHAHVMGGGFLDDVAAGAELGAAQDVAGADDDGQLHAAAHDPLGLAGDVQRLVNADAALAAVAEAFAAQLEDHPLVMRLQLVLVRVCVHEDSVASMMSSVPPLPSGDWRRRLRLSVGLPQTRSAGAPR